MGGRTSSQDEAHGLGKAKCCITSLSSLLSHLSLPHCCGSQSPLLHLCFIFTSLNHCYVCLIITSLKHCCVALAHRYAPVSSLHLSGIITSCSLLHLFAALLYLFLTHLPLPHWGHTSYVLCLLLPLFDVIPLFHFAETRKTSVPKVLDHFLHGDDA